MGIVRSIITYLRVTVESLLVGYPISMVAVKLQALLAIRISTDVRAQILQDVFPERISKVHERQK